ncbi:MAG: DUF2793 domain-containing protein [Alphaproteobacteria bacterium]|nr:MAG: DUF2793 domain-containing protein [Alphaproteobacteria bacterium]
MTTTPRLLLPHILTNQAQKEITHNEALNRIDALLLPAVESMDILSPPAAPAEGALYVVPAGATDGFAGQDGNFAHFIAGAWQFFAPPEGAQVFVKDRGVPALYRNGGWTIGDLQADRLVIAGSQVVGARQAAIADPAGGTTVDSEARQAITAILGALRAHGLIAS